jgi:hypothetical protein
MQLPPVVSPLQRHDDPDPARRLIPGAYEQNTVIVPQAGALGGAYGTDGLSNGPGTMSSATIAERRKEGGGGGGRGGTP